MAEEFKSSNGLYFEAAPWYATPEFLEFKVGTCYGLWGVTDETYDILVVFNREKGNGHLQDVFDWFENSCRRDKKDLRILEVWNAKFKNHLLTKRGFEKHGEEDDVIKIIKKV